MTKTSSKCAQHPLLENAVTSIQLGLEDYKSDDSRRVISAARNLYAGVLLLCKEVLRRISPRDSNDILIRSRKKAIRAADGSVRFVGEGKKTIDRAEIVELFKQLTVKVDLAKLDRLAAIRNEIEHMHPSMGPALIQEAIADAMPMIHAAITNELFEEPSDLLGEDAWEAMLDETRVFQAEQEACRASYEGVDWKSEAVAKAVTEFRCPTCSSPLLKNIAQGAASFDELVLACSKCGTEADREEVIEKALEESLQPDFYIAMIDGGDSPLSTCPDCGRETYVTAEDRCVLCQFSAAGYVCAICSSPLTVEEIRYGDGELCSYHEHLMSKDD